MAEVYKARAVEGPRAGQLAAVKRLTPKLTGDPEAVDLFCGEADVSSMLKHPNIVEVFEAGVVGEGYYPPPAFVHGRHPAPLLPPRPPPQNFPPPPLSPHTPTPPPP